MTLGTCYGFGVYYCPFNNYIPEATLSFPQVAKTLACTAAKPSGLAASSSSSCVAPATPSSRSARGLTCMQSVSPDLVVHWTVADTKTNFLVQAKTSGWVAFGPGKSMVGSQVVMGNLAGDTAPAVYALGGYSPSDVTKASAQSASAVSVQTVDGETLLSFTLPLPKASGRRRAQQSFIAAFGDST